MRELKMWYFCSTHQAWVQGKNMFGHNQDTCNFGEMSYD